MNDHEGLVSAYLLDGKGGAVELDWSGVETWGAADGVLWLHLDHNAPVSEAWLRERSGLKDYQIDALLAEETRPRVADMHEGLLITLRGVNLNPGADPEDMVSLRMWADKHRVITVRLRRLMAVNDVCERFGVGSGPVDSGDLIRMIASRLAHRMSPVIEGMNDEIDDLEKAVVDEAGADLRHRLKETRRQAIALRRYLAPQRDAVGRLYDDAVDWIHHEQRLMFRECADQVARIVEDLDAMRERASVVQDELSNRMAEHMNRNMYTLSVVAALMLPLGVITGVLGMNVGGIPLAENTHGFTVISILLVAVVVLQVLIFRRLRWI